MFSLLLFSLINRERISRQRPSLDQNNGFLKKRKHFSETSRNRQVQQKILSTNIHGSFRLPDLLKSKYLRTVCDYRSQC